MAFEGNIAPFITFIREGILSRFSRRDLKEFKEVSVKALILTILGITGLYQPVSEHKVDKGFVDIFLRKDPRCNFPYEWILELKYVPLKEKKNIEKEISRIPSSLFPEDIPFELLENDEQGISSKEETSFKKRVEVSRKGAIDQLQKYNITTNPEYIIESSLREKEVFFRGKNIKKAYLIVTGKCEIIWGEVM